MKSWLAAALVATLAFPGLSMALPGDLDPSFGTGGVVITDIGRHTATAEAVLVDPGGRIVVAGVVGDGIAFALVRYRADGSLDPSFGSTGQVLTPLGGGIGGGARALAVDADRRIIVAGDTGGRVALARYLGNGRLDRTFGTDGMVFTTLAGFAHIQALAIQPDGTFLVGGSLRSAGGPEHHAIVVRYSPDGTLDRTFGDDGTARIEIGEYSEGITSLALQRDGEIVVAGAFDSDHGFVARFLAGGTLDPSFASSGIRIEPGATFDHVSVAVQADGSVVTALAAKQAFVVRRYTADGHVDDAFGNGGTTVAPFGNSAFVRSVVVQGDGSITVAGLTSRAYRWRLAVARFVRDGAPDATFGVGGQLTARVAAFGDVAIAPGGELVFAGTALNEIDHANREFAVARFHADGSADSGFGNGGAVRTELSGGGDRLTGIALEAGGGILVGGTVSGGETSADYALARYKPDGSLDPSFGDGGRARIDTRPEDSRDGDPSDDHANAMALQRDGKIIFAGTTRGQEDDVLLSRLTPAGALDPSFGWEGRVVSGTLDDELPTAVALQPNGRIVVAGTTSGDGAPAIILLRFLPDGRRDASFGDAGLVRDLFVAGDSKSTALAIDRNGAILVAGSVRRDDDSFVYRPALARYGPDGRPDPGFGTAGKVVLDLGPSEATLSAVALQRDGGIVAVGRSEASDDFLVMRLRRNGKLDTAFGNGGVAAAGLAGGAASAVAIDAHGRIVVGGSATVGGVKCFALARFLKDGRLDAGFGRGGTIVTAIGKGAAASVLALQPNGDVLLAGSADGRRGADFAVARYLGGTAR